MKIFNSFSNNFSNSILRIDTLNGFIFVMDKVISVKVEITNREII